MKNKETRLNIALQKSGRLSEKSFELLSKCGLELAQGKRSLICRSQELPVDVLLLRDDDVPTFVSEGVCDIGIVGQNVLLEETLGTKEGENLETVMELGFSGCRLSIALPKEKEYNSLEDIKGCKLATTYPKILQNFLDKNKINAMAVKMEGSVEIAPSLGLADGICDIVSSGATLEAHGLVEVEKIFQSQAVLVGRKNMSVEKRAILVTILERIKGVRAAAKSKYVMLNAPKSKLKDICALLPGSESPTIIPLADENKVAVHAVCLEPVFWSTMESLKSAGATSVLILPIEKMLV
ncbi:ATP phosphoribosyltransferase [Elusimicrobium minutum Pei191]|uniref:ATP phosphoribosyltransferase n=1 Tax=Elusimicrobium minutum (strain Pei191) TaxID=445932 RepID=B2KCM3_ELUMP|nr:ATP phosphoribosyltransferase [Elusimicrobium minutum]ACC98269.1 ATP phosphoribosyltransferase [Elusimicrobium minutum Pei191]